MSGAHRSEKSDLFPSAALSSASLKSKINLIQSKMSTKGQKKSNIENVCQDCRYPPPCMFGSSPTVRRILGACMVSLLTLLGSITIDLRDCIMEWRNTEAALQAFSSCTDLIAIKFIQFLQDQRTFCCWNHMNLTGRRTLLLNNMGLFCDEAQDLYEENCEDTTEVSRICEILLDKVLLMSENITEGDFRDWLSTIISEILDNFIDLNEDLNIIKTNHGWADVLSLHILIRAQEEILRTNGSTLSSSTDLQPLEFETRTMLNYALYTSDTLCSCWINSYNISKFLIKYHNIYFLTPFSNVSVFGHRALVDGLASLQECFYPEGYKKLSNKSKDILSTLSLKVTLLTVSCLIYPIVLVSFKQMTEWIQNYAQNLKERTEDLKKERRLAEELLHQMLPKSVAKQLRKKSHVEAESYDQVTIFFSDVVGFTSISASCTPLQVVEMLNNLYVCFDTRIESFNVYKVETIGDAYMVVSGLPERSNKKHADEIAKMSLDLVAAVRQVIIPHMPNERLQLRAGIHTAQKIHISSATYQELIIDNAYEIEPRGEIEVKGKGKMKTYWLLGNKNYSVQNDSLVCHWNPNMPRRKKVDSSLGSGLQSLSSNVPSEASRGATPRILEESAPEHGATSPPGLSTKMGEALHDAKKGANTKSDQMVTLKLPEKTDQGTSRKISLEKNLPLPGFVEESV
ncbi:uncharacterized protein LOC120915519 isoform X2 [Rana temporaria]|uniref:uncharacterized protein LOC120915519 isoform X2 n=1 Tax=Rana temporaria TaxID=8407 RepID=UPI001AACD77F|nr:uncharacterized protein LOC120915519 isoform X2 [Rana temporaria]